MRADGTVEAVAGTPKAEPEPDGARRVVSAWTWGTSRAPRRLEPAQVGREKLPDDPGRLEVRVIRRSSGRPPEDLRVIAAPGEMWREVPEALLPSWPVPQEGKLSIPVDASRVWRLRVAAKSEGSWWSAIRPGQKTVTLTSAPAAGLEVQVLGPDQRPVEGARGLLQPGGRGGGGVLSPWAGLQGENGRLDAPGLPDEAELSLTVMKPGFAPLIVRGRPSAIPRQVRLAPGGELTGRLVDSKRQPVGGAEVAAEAFAADGQTQLFSVQTRSGSDGSWRVAGLPAGMVAWSVRAPGFVPLTGTFPVEAGERTDLGVRSLEPGAKLSIQVVDDIGAPVPGAQVLLRRDARVEMADGQGRVTFDGIAPAPLEVSASAERHSANRAVFNPPFAPGLRLVLQRSFTVTGRLVDAAGVPVVRGRALLASGTSQCEDRLDLEGRFELDVLPGTRDAELVLRSPEVQELRVRLEPGEAGEVRDLGDLRATSGRTVTGRVVRASDGTPVPGARVWTTRPGPDGPAVAWATGDFLEGVAGEDGRFRLAGLLPLAASLRVEAAGYARTRIEVPAGATDEAESGGPVEVGDVLLREGATVRVKVEARNEDGQEMRGVVARVDLGNRWLEPDLLSAEVWQGEALFSNVPAGPVTVSAVAGRRLL
ncbi:MAG TPA: carboxypeptidase-like regulatory domain-containing protein, partial [Thermoanaerobaculia bacterium]|nr:carboxypeptidase-like regulatory domain-containing protein [Thermoanaerobaculia bacterium]